MPWLENNKRSLSVGPHEIVFNAASPRAPDINNSVAGFVNTPVVSSIDTPVVSSIDTPVQTVSSAKQTTLTQIYQVSSNLDPLDEVEEDEMEMDEENDWAPVKKRDYLNGLVQDRNLLRNTNFVTREYWPVVFREVKPKWKHKMKHFSCPCSQVYDVLNGNHAFIFWDHREGAARPMLGQQVKILSIAVCNEPDYFSCILAKVFFVFWKCIDFIDIRITQNGNKIPCKCITLESNEMRDLTVDTVVLLDRDADYFKFPQNAVNNIEWRQEDLILYNQKEHILVARVAEIQLVPDNMPGTQGNAFIYKFAYDLSLLGVFDKNAKITDFDDVSDDMGSLPPGTIKFKKEYYLRRVECGALTAFDDYIDTSEDAPVYEVQMDVTKPHAGLQQNQLFYFKKGEWIQNNVTKDIFQIQQKKLVPFEYVTKQVGLVDSKENEVILNDLENLGQCVKITNWNSASVANELNKLDLSAPNVFKPSSRVLQTVLSTRPHMDVPDLEPTQNKVLESCHLMNKVNLWNQKWCWIKNVVLERKDPKIKWTRELQSYFYGPKNQVAFGRPYDRWVENIVRVGQPVIFVETWEKFLKYKEGIVLQIGYHEDVDRTQGCVIRVKVCKPAPADVVVVDSACTKSGRDRHQCMFFFYFYVFLFGIDVLCSKRKNYFFCFYVFLLKHIMFVRKNYFLLFCGLMYFVVY